MSLKQLVVNFMTKSGECGKLVPLVILVLLPEVLYLYLDKRRGWGMRLNKEDVKSCNILL